MIWIKFHHTDRIEVLQDFKYTGPLKGKSKYDYWSNMSFHSIKIKVSSDFDIDYLKEKSFRDITYKSKDGNYYDAKFRVWSIIGLSQTKKFKTYKITVEGLETQLVSINDRRDLAILDLLQDEN